MEKIVTATTATITAAITATATRMNNTTTSNSIDLVKRLKQHLESQLLPKGYEVAPFLCGWYNECVEQHYRLQYPQDTLCFIVISNTNMWKTFEKFYIETSASGNDVSLPSTDFLDTFTKDVLQKAVGSLSLSECECEFNPDILYDFELVNHRPKILVQTAGHVAGIAHYYQKQQIHHQPEHWKGKPIAGVAIHPKYGGWFAFRAAVIFRSVLVPKLPQVEPIDVFQGNEEKKVALLDSFNLRWRDSTFRDCIPVPDEFKYSNDQINYFLARASERKARLSHFFGHLKENS